MTSLASVTSNYWLADSQVVRSERISELKRFIQSSEAFEPLMRAHMLNLIHGDDATKSKEALIKNIQDQHVILDSIRAYVPAAQANDADRYAKVFVATASALESAKNPLTAGPLMQQANDAVVSKRKLVAALRQGAGLPSGSS